MSGVPHLPPTEPATPSSMSRFDGPLDLLLDLINRRELDITTVSLAAVAEQYLEEVSRLVEADLERLAGYLVIASRLLLIKSQALLPRPVLPGAEPEEDDGAELLRQLEEYKRFKMLAGRLREIEELGRRVFTRPVPPHPIIRPAPGAGQPLYLAEALRRALALAPEMPTQETVAPPRFPVALKIADLEESLKRHPRVSFSALASTASCRQEVIALFLALLEIVRRGGAMVWQEGLFGEILLSAHPHPPGNEEGEQPQGRPNGVDGYVDGVAEPSGDEQLMDLVGDPVKAGSQPSPEVRGPGS